MTTPDDISVELATQETIFIELNEGIPGPPGPAGRDGRDGIDGKDGADGATGPAGPPGASADGTSIARVYHVQSTPEREWLIYHELGDVKPVVEIYDTNGDEVFADVHHLPGLVVVEFAFETTGMVQLL